jgi:DNA repair protein RadC
MMAEKFSVSELAALRNELLLGGLDSLQAAELLQIFLKGRGYGVSPEAALDAASRVEGAGCSVDVLQKELETIALVM